MIFSIDSIKHKYEKQISRDQSSYRYKPTKFYYLYLKNSNFTIKSNTLVNLELINLSIIIPDIECKQLKKLTIKDSPELSKISDKIQHLTNVQIVIINCPKLNPDYELFRMTNVKFI
jgi:hypothetical protein